MTENDNTVFLYEKFWRDGLSITIPEQTAKVIATELLIPDRIDLLAFGHNLRRFLNKGLVTLEETLYPGQGKICITPSITEASSPLSCLPLFPDWFIVAYPDVFLWFRDLLTECVTDRKESEDAADVKIKLISELANIDIEKDVLKNEDIFDSDKKLIPKYLRNLISSYKQRTGKALETSVNETNNKSIREIYDYPEVQREIAESGIDTFTLIARKTTLYYLELSKNYKHRFQNETALLTTAGILDALVYILTDKIQIHEILEIAKIATAGEEEPLVEFIVRLEANILFVDTPEISQRRVFLCCQEEKPRICNEINRVRKEGQVQQSISKDVQLFMDSSDYSEIRKILSIK